MADTCNSFATYICAKGVHNGASIGGAGTLMGDGLLLSGNTFTVSTHNGSGGGGRNYPCGLCSWNTDWHPERDRLQQLEHLAGRRRHPR